jgi:hypothetical protein
MQVGWEKTVTAADREMISRAESAVKERPHSRRRGIAFKSGVLPKNEKSATSSPKAIPSPLLPVLEGRPAAIEVLHELEENAQNPSAESDCGTCARITRDGTPAEWFGERRQVRLTSDPWGTEAPFGGDPEFWGPEAFAWWPDGDGYAGLIAELFAWDEWHRPTNRPMGR